MTKDELTLWERYESARKELILFYLPLTILWARRISKVAAWANWEDLKQDGIIGLMNAITRFDSSQGVPFRPFARHYIRGAIFDSPELTRNLARRQEEVYRKMRQAEAELTKTLRRNPTIEEVAEKTGLTIEQIQNAIDAMGVAFAGELPGAEDAPPPSAIEVPQPDKSILVEEALSRLSGTEQEIVRLYYLEDQSHEKIAEKLEIIPVEVTKIRQRAIGKVAKICQRAITKLHKQFDVKEKGGPDEDRRSGK
ncbi:MAG TPA: sigma-70 family RNA polymerase sigma factor [Blastocatellia bacterium]|jgi:RNA polymerase sigma factor (sigma-70 family)